MFAAGVVLLACVPLYNALRSSGPRKLAAVLVGVLAVAAVVQVALVAQYVLTRTGRAGDSSLWWNYSSFFFPGLFNLDEVTRHLRPSSESANLVAFVGELLKWGAVLAIALWLSIAQIASWRRAPSPLPAVAARASHGVGLRRWLPWLPDRNAPNAPLAAPVRYSAVPLASGGLRPCP